MREHDAGKAGEQQQPEGDALCRLGTRPVGDLEDLLRAIDAGDEPDEAPGEFVDQHPARVDLREIERDGEEEDEEGARGPE